VLFRSCAVPALADHNAATAAPQAPQTLGENIGGRVVYRVDCDSEDYGQSRCEAPEGVYVFRVALIRQDSATACVEDENWGRDPRGVWVDDGCSAEFRMFGRNIGDAAPETLSCSSGNYDRTNCRAEGLVFSARLERQRSSAACVEGDNWGWDQYGVWVDDGCRADFLLNDPRDDGMFGGGAWGARGGGRGASRDFGPGHGVRTPAQPSHGWGLSRGEDAEQPAISSPTPSAVSADPYAVDTDVWSARGFDGRQEAVGLCSRRIMRAAWEDADYSAQFERAPEVAPAVSQVASMGPAGGGSWRVTGPVIIHSRYGYERVHVACTVEGGHVSTFQARADGVSGEG